VNSTAVPTGNRRRTWRFSLRELLLGGVAIAALLGWGQSQYYRFERVVPSPVLAQHYEWDVDLRSCLERVGGSTSVSLEESWSSRPAQFSFYHDRTYVLVISEENTDAFLDAFHQRVEEGVRTSGGKTSHKYRHRFDLKSGDQMFVVNYECGRVNGFVRVVLRRKANDEVRLEVITYETRWRN